MFFLCGVISLYIYILYGQSYILLLLGYIVIYIYIHTLYSYCYIYIHIHTPFLKVTGSRAAAGPRQLPGHARLSAHLGRWHAWAQPGDLTLFDGLEELVGTPLAGNQT